MAERLIATGTFSLVYQVSRKHESDQSRKFALKRCFIMDDFALRRILQECRVLEKVSNKSPFLPTLYSVFIVNTSVAIVMTAGCGIDLSELLFLRKTMDETAMRFYAVEMLCGLEHLHALKIVYVDMKPENIILKTTGHIMLTDFDHALDISSGPKHHPNYAAGTLCFKSPELANGHLIDEKSDIWSWASILVELIDGYVCDASLPQQVLLKEAEKRTVTMKSFKKYSENLQRLLDSCFQINVTLRPTVAEIKGHKFFEGISWDDVTSGGLLPPFEISDYDFHVLEHSNSYKAFDPLVLNNFYESEMIDIDDKIKRSDGSYSYRKYDQNTEGLRRAGRTEENIIALFSKFPRMFSDYSTGSVNP